jgi:hypothetical protein
MSNECTCSDAACSAKLCAATACACGFTEAGTTCDGDLAAGVTDKSCAAGCDGTGACEQPLLWFTFDEPANAGTLANRGTWPGTVTRFGGAQGMPGMVGNAIAFIQPTDGVVIADPADGSLDSFASWTIETWVNFATLQNNANLTFAKKNLGYLCRGVMSGNQFFHQGIVFTPMQQGANFVMTPPATNTWNHAACTFGAGTLRLYWNGGLVASATVAGAMSDTTSDLGIGQSSTDTEHLTGMMDDFRMWSTTRTDRQICLAACGTFSAGTCTFDNVCGN